VATDAASASPSIGCELCEAAVVSERFANDELCWIAECESCFVPMVVWRQHDPEPPADVRAELHRRLLAVVTTHFDVGDVASAVWIDDQLRSIPGHYHAHARPRGGPGALRRRSHAAGTRPAGSGAAGMRPATSTPTNGAPILRRST
jgi:hypothetical protein